MFNITIEKDNYPKNDFSDNYKKVKFVFHLYNYYNYYYYYKLDIVLDMINILYLWENYPNNAQQDIHNKVIHENINVRVI